MTKKSIKRLAGRVGGIKNLALIPLAILWFLILLLDIFVVEKIFDPLGYLYLALGIVVLLYVVWPLYTSRRLVRYYWQRVKRNRLAVVGLGFILFLCLRALFGPLFPADPTAVNFEEKNVPPVGFSIEESLYNAETGQFITKTASGTWEHPLGTDNKGRDLLAMIVSGAGVSLQVGLLATGIAVALGTLIGVVSAYLGGKVDNILMRFTAIMMTFPFFLLLVFIVFLFGPSLAFIVLVIGLTGWTGTARLIRRETLSLRTREFILA